ncbi:MAG: hypothetical protein FDZ70_01015 [Actinobacteria bacterium]|nr:MAG: hypothetical protein FDZ70_01015 [Actinomycetota bacterium]
MVLGASIAALLVVLSNGGSLIVSISNVTAIVAMVVVDVAAASDAREHSDLVRGRCGRYAGVRS